MMSNMRTEFEVTIRCTFLLALFFSEIRHSSALLIMRSCSGLACIAASSSSADTLHASIGIPVNGHGISLIKVIKSPVMSRFRLLGSQRYFERTFQYAVVVEANRLSRHDLSLVTVKRTRMSLDRTIRLCTPVSVPACICLLNRCILSS